MLVPGTAGTIQLTAGAAGGLVSCWIDFSRDGDWSNQASGRGDSPSGTPVTDIAQEGGDPDPDDDGDSSDDNTPTSIVLPASPVEIPTLGTWGLMALILLLGVLAVRRMRRPAQG